VPDQRSDRLRGSGFSEELEVQAFHKMLTLSIRNIAGLRVLWRAKRLGRTNTKRGRFYLAQRGHFYLAITMALAIIYLTKGASFETFTR
jgi:hypothetical protein